MRARVGGRELVREAWLLPIWEESKGKQCGTHVADRALTLASLDAGLTWGLR
jgi:hypothetical protein